MACVLERRAPARAARLVSPDCL